VQYLNIADEKYHSGTRWKYCLSFWK